MKYLIDTHVLLWWYYGEDKLSTKATHILSEPKNEIYVSAASALEISTKHRIGKLPAAKPLLERYDYYLRKARFNALDINNRHSLLAGALPLHHKDPFDRLLIATAKTEKIPIISLDTQFKKYKVRVIW